jgi:hypothetical protein
MPRQLSAGVRYSPCPLKCKRGRERIDPDIDNHVCQVCYTTLIVCEGIVNLFVRIWLVAEL